MGAGSRGRRAVENGEWYFLMSNAFPDARPRWLGALPEPFVHAHAVGQRHLRQFGDEFAVPVVGNFDPPVTAGGSVTPIGVTNLDNRFDVNADGRVDALDALILINDINANGQRPLTHGTLQAPFLDVMRDGAGFRWRRAGRDQRRQRRPSAAWVAKAREWRSPRMTGPPPWCRRRRTRLWWRIR